MSNTVTYSRADLGVGIWQQPMLFHHLSRREASLNSFVCGKIYPKNKFNPRSEKMEKMEKQRKIIKGDLMSKVKDLRGYR